MHPVSPARPRRTMSSRRIVVPLMLALALFAGACNSKSVNTSPAPTPAAATPTSAGVATTAPSASPATEPAACPTSNTTSFAKTKFVLHAGLAFGAFHRYLYKPFKAGTFTSGGTAHKILVFAKAGTAALFIKREIRLSIEDVKASPLLCKAIAAPLGSLSNTISGAVTKLKSGDTSALTDANTAIASIEAQARQGGAAIAEVANAHVG